MNDKIIAIISIIALVLSSANLAFMLIPRTTTSTLLTPSNELEPLALGWDYSHDLMIVNNNSMPLYNIVLSLQWNFPPDENYVYNWDNGTFIQRTFVNLMPNETYTMAWYPQVDETVQEDLSAFASNEQTSIAEGENIQMSLIAYGNTQPNEQNAPIPPNPQYMALPSPPPQAEQGQVTNLQFTAGDATHGSVLITFNNTGTTTITLTQLWVNNVQYTPVPALGPALANSGAQYNVTMAITSGYQYSVTLQSAKGSKFTSTGSAPT